MLRFDEENFKFEVETFKQKIKAIKSLTKIIIRKTPSTKLSNF